MKTLQDVAQYIEEILSQGIDVMPNSPVHLAENCKESESMEWEAEIYDIITPKKEKQ